MTETKTLEWKDGEPDCKTCRATLEKMRAVGLGVDEAEAQNVLAAYHMNGHPAPPSGD